LLLTVLAMLGCGAGSEGDVQGKVLLQGKEVPSGTVTFRGADGREVSSVIRGGVYQVGKLAVGEARIGVVGHNRAPSALLRPSGPGAPANPVIEKPVVVHDRYKKAETSPLKCHVKPGTQSHDIELEP
jgi:hypothetical protein